MTQDIVNNNQSISYTNLDFSSIYTEVLNLIKNLTYKWDPSISDESDPGVILAKLSALIADKCNYNIDKSILEAFPLSVTQEANAQQLYEQLGYYMNWYESATTPVALSWISSPEDNNSEIKSYTIPKFTIITNDEANIDYALIGIEGPNGIVVSDGILTTDSKELKMIAMEGIPAKYSYLGKETVITAQMVDKYTHRLYFETSYVAQNGIFITNTNQNNYADWKRVDNIYEQSYNELRYKFGYDNYSNSCYIEFPDNYSELFGDGIEITYLDLSPLSENVGDFTSGNIPAQGLIKFLEGVTPKEDPTVFLDAANVTIQNYAAASGHREKESINDAYKNYKKTVGTFKTLITLRDYLNYIKSQDLDICSNAFVCDRTNDIQSVYKIVSKQHDLDSIIVKVEQIVDKTAIESNFDYKFQLTEDTAPIPGKIYYTITNDTLSEIQNTTGANPHLNGWYEFTSYIASSHDALTPFSLKFYLLNNSISLNSKQAFDETFELSKQTLDMETILGETVHLEHTFEDILPLGENTYKVSTDNTFLKNKAYYVKANDNTTYRLYTNYEVGDSTDSLTTTLYELDVEALLPHIVLFKNIYPLSMNVLTYDSLNAKTQQEIQKNIISTLYQGVNSSQLNFGDAIDTNYLIEIVKNSDDRIKEVYFDSITYTTKAVYYDEYDKEFKEILLSSKSSDITLDQKDLDSILAKLVEKDIICKSILSGVTYLLTPDDVFSFHLNQKFINYYDDIYSITSQAIIDIGGNDAITTYSSDTSNPYIRKSYVLKPNETISLYRPQLETIREFSAGIHFECFLYNDVKANQSYELQKNEYIIFYQATYADTSNAGAGMPSGFSVYACTEGIIFTPSFDIASQTNFNSLTSFARSKVVPNFDVSDSGNWYETNTYAYSYVMEIYNNSSILNNSITGTNSIKIQSLYTVDIEISDNYKFFWVLKTPQYSLDKTLKTYTLFPEYDVTTERLYDKEINSYTLKEGEWLYYTDSSYSNLAILGAGTTIYRNCGINAKYTDDDPITSFSYVNTKEFSESGTDIRFKDGILETITTQVAGEDTINPKLNGWYEAQGTTPETYQRSQDVVYDSSKDYFVLVMEDNSGLFKRIGDSAPYEHSSTLQTSDVFSEVNVENYMSNINPKEKGWYEIVTCMNSRVTDYYALSDGASYNDYLRYTSTLDESILSRNIFDIADYTDVDISNTDTYKTIYITPSNASNFDYISQRLLVPTNGYESYKAYYTDDTGDTRITDIKVIDNPMQLGWYEESSTDTFTLTADTSPQILDTDNSLSYPTSLTENYCFDEVNITNWNNRSFLLNGYFYKLNSSESAFVWDREKTNVNELVTAQNLSYLLSIYSEAKTHYPSDADATSLINYIIYNWKDSITYNHPFKLENKLGWRTKIFREISGSETATYLGITRSEYEQCSSAVASYQIYPRYDRNIVNGAFTSSIDVVIPVDALNLLPDTANPVELIDTGNYIEILDRTTQSDLNLKIYLEYLYTTFNNKYISSFGMELLLKLFRFKDLFKMSNKSYFIPNIYVTKTFSTIDSWTCTALDNDQVADDPVKVISGGDNEDDPPKWQTMQDNTSLRIVQNELWSFSEGDILRFEVPVASQNSVVWPRFSNTEISLDLDSYSISYQRNGASIEDLDKLSLEQYDWRGNSNLLLNTSSRDGQKLETNHSIILYKPIPLYSSDSTYKVGDKCIYEHEFYKCITAINTPEAWDSTHWEATVEYFAIINGSDYENVTFQLKNPVSNVTGRYIDVTYENILGDTISNSVYEFVPLTSGDRYKYVSDNNTQVLFDVEPYSGIPSHRINNTQVKVPLLLPEGHYILPVHTSTPGVKYWVSKYVEARKSTSYSYCINLSPVLSSNNALTVRISHNVDSNGESYGEHLYGYDKDKFVGTSDSNFYINDTKYHYLDLSIDMNPEADDYVKVSLPAHLSEYYSSRWGVTASPQWFGWYELHDGEYTLSSNTGTGGSLLEQITLDLTDYNVIKYNNPSELVWYERSENEPYYYTLSTDTEVNPSKTYYKDKDFYVSSSMLEYPVLKINAENPLLDIDSDEIQIIFGDIYKYDENEEFSEEMFKEIKLKLRRLDDESLYNYSFKSDSNAEIKDPLVSVSFFENSHPFHQFIISQLDFDNVSFRFTTGNTSRR